MDDSRIVDLYLSRDKTAVSQTAEKYGAKLRCIANRILDDLPAAEECENDTYFSAWNLIPPNEPRTCLFPFLGRITRHIAIDAVRKRRAGKRNAVFCELTKEMEECIPSWSGSVENAAEASELSGIISAFLEKHTQDQQNVFVRRYWYFDPVREISRRYGFSVSKVKMMLSRMRAELREVLEKEGYSV